MAYPTNWNTYKADASMLVALDPINKIQGTSSLRMNRNSTTGRYANIVRASAPKGFTSGTFRGLFSNIARTQNDRYGFAFMLSQEDLTGSVGSFYTAAWDHANSSGAVRPRLQKYTAGLVTAPTLLAQHTSDITTATGQLLAMSMTWTYDLATYQGTFLSFSFGTSADFSGMTTISFVDTSSPLGTSVGEGSFLYLASTSSTGDYLHDSQQCDPYVA